MFRSAHASSPTCAAGRASRSPRFLLLCRLLGLEDRHRLVGERYRQRLAVLGLFTKYPGGLSRQIHLGPFQVRHVGPPKPGLQAEFRHGSQMLRQLRDQPVGLFARDPAHATLRPLERLDLGHTVDPFPFVARLVQHGAESREKPIDRVDAWRAFTLLSGLVDPDVGLLPFGDDVLHQRLVDLVEVFVAEIRVKPAQCVLVVFQ